MSDATHAPDTIALMADNALDAALQRNLHVDICGTPSVIVEAMKSFRTAIPSTAEFARLHINAAVERWSAALGREEPSHE